MTDYPRTPRLGLPLVPDKDRAWGPAMRQAMTDLDNAVPWKASRHVLATTPSLGYYQTANIEIELVQSCELISTLVDRECWVRVYGSAAARTRDAARQPDTKAPKGRGLYAQTHPYPPDDLTTQWSKAPFFHNLDTPKTGTAYLAVTNLAVGYEGPINLDFEFLPQEQFTPSGPMGDTGLPGRTLLVLTAPPTGAQGQDGDGAIDKVGKMFYGPKSGGAWPEGVSLQGPPGNDGLNGTPGTNGTDGKQLRSGPIDPTAAIGVDGEFYYNYTSKYIFGPKAAGVWPAGTSLVGPAGTNGLDGNTVLYGTTDPTAADGVNGNFYINKATWFIFGPKASGVWPAGTSLVGPAGAGGGMDPTALTYSMVDQFSPVSEVSGNYTSGIKFFVGKAPSLKCSGVRAYGFNGRSYRLSIWGPTGTRLASIDFTCTSTGIFQALFSSPVLLSNNTEYRISIWQITGAYNNVRTTGYTTNPPFINPYLYITAISLYATGDAAPTIGGGNDRYAIDPILSL